MVAAADLGSDLLLSTDVLGGLRDPCGRSVRAAPRFATGSSTEASSGRAAATYTPGETLRRSAFLAPLARLVPAQGESQPKEDGAAMKVSKAVQTVPAGAAEPAVPARPAAAAAFVAATAATESPPEVCVEDPDDDDAESTAASTADTEARLPDTPGSIAGSSSAPAAALTGSAGPAAYSAGIGGSAMPVGLQPQAPTTQKAGASGTAVRAPPGLLGSPDMPTLGSAEHHLGKCKPCAFVFKDGCLNGTSCKFCHLCAPGEKKRRKKARREIRRASRQGW